MKALLVYPRYPDTFWSFRHAVRVSSKKAVFPPLGLLTVGSMLPQEWDKKLIDMNVSNLTDSDILWADYVFISAMVIQRESVEEVIQKCKRLGTRIVAGGPLFTSEPDEFEAVDHLVLDEAEITLPLFLEDLSKGHPKHIYTSHERPDITKTPLPMWPLIDMKKYTAMSLQYSRGCPFDCDFCNIAVLNGRNVRTKSKDQVMAELDALYSRGWRSSVFIVDDNFIGNKRKLKEEILPGIIEWQQRRKYPFSLSTQVSINLADDEELLRLLVTAGFDGVFVGIESPNEESLAECNKRQNEHRDIVASVKKLQNHGLQVQAGFILGFDSDPVSVFKSQIKLVQQSGIVMAMVGLLNAPRGTRLYRRMAEENRLTEEKATGDNTDCSMNFVPKMDRATLVSGYKEVLTSLYSPRQYYPRIKMFLKQYRPQRRKAISQLKWWHIWTWLRSMWFLGITDQGRLYYWRFVFSTLMKRPRSFPLSMTLAVYGFHFWTVARRLQYS
ncbi:MAG: DUF4070 domain-containing protein [Chloroflexi bacterium]|nr:DUF4070 domain-containing protein [Chloroflexota bacterium]